MTPDQRGNNGYWFMSLESGRKLSHWACAHIPIPTHAVNRVNQLGEADDHPIIRKEDDGIQSVDDDSNNNVPHHINHDESTGVEVSVNDLNDQQNILKQYQHNNWCN